VKTKTVEGRTLKVEGVLLTLAALVTAPVAAQEPAPPVPAQAPAPAATPAPAAVPVPAWAQGPNAPRRGWFGVQLSCDECYISRGGRVAYTVRPRVSWVEDGSPSYAAGIRAGDTIVTVDGADITTPEGFERFAGALPGQPVRIGLRKAGQEREVTVVPSANSGSSTISSFYNERARIAQRQGIRALQQAFRSPMGWLGLSIECEQCTVSTSARRQNWRFRQPAAVKMVDVDGPANRAGLRRGDTLTAIDGVDLTTNEGGQAFGAIEPNQRVTLTVRRDGRERRVTLTAVPNPDATPAELAAYDEYRRTRDSTDAVYREAVTASVARAQVEMRELERQLLALQSNRGGIDSSRRRVAVIDSLLRALRTAERQRGELGFAYGIGYGPSVMAVPMVAPVAVSPMYAQAGGTWPLRYSDRLGAVANVEARSAGAVNVSQVGDSLLVLTGAGFEVKVQLRPQGRR